MSRTLASTPRADGFFMPAEFTPHAGTWMLWPQRPDNWRLGAKPAQKAFAAVACAIAQFEPVTMGINHSQYANARQMLPPEIRVVELSNNDSWMRDCGPTFVVNDQGQVRGIDWMFNAWGGLYNGLYFPWDLDDAVAGKVLEIERVDRYKAPLVLEGGSIHVDGEGTCLTTAECLLSPGRKGGISIALHSSSRDTICLTNFHLSFSPGEPMTPKKLAVIAIGGNSLIKDDKNVTVESQYQAAKETCEHIADMIEQGWDVAIGHGNGPQVGFILRRSEIAAKTAGMHEVPLDVCGADSQGAIGYALQQNLQNILYQRGIKKKVVTVITQVLVDKNDPAFAHPTKPIGSFMDEAEAKRRAAEQGWSVVEDAGRGWRRVVASPLPKEIVELETVQTLLDVGIVTVTVGGGGIPVIDPGDGNYQGIAAVIDKDYASSLLAREIKADLFVISTAVEKVALNFGKPDQQWLDKITLSEAKKYLAEGTHFAKGSMAPKIQAVIWFLEANPNGKALITNPENLGCALKGETGTWIVQDGQ